MNEPGETLSEGETESDVVRQLRALAKVPDDVNTFTIQRRSVAVDVYYASGSGSHVSLTAPYPTGPRERAPDPSAQGGGYRTAAAEPVVQGIRPLNIVLKPETASERDAKAQLITREFQTGDDTFDDLVFIDTPTNDEVLAVIFKQPEVRAAIRTLLAEGLRSVLIDTPSAATISASIYGFAHAKHDAQRAERMVEAFATLVEHIPYVAPSGEARAPDRAAGLLGLASIPAALLFFGGAPLFFGLAPERCLVSSGDGQSFVCTGHHCCEGPALGLFVGLLAGVVLAIVFGAQFSGKSDSHTNRTMAHVVVTFLVTAVSFFAFSLVLWHS